MSIDRRIKNMWYTYATKYYSVTKRNETMTSAAKEMVLEITIRTEVSQKEKNKYHTISLICGI